MLLRLLLLLLLLLQMRWAKSACKADLLSRLLGWLYLHLPLPELLIS